MTDLVLDALLEFLLWWSLITACYAGVILTLDWLVSVWQDRRSARQAELRRLEQIDADARMSVARLAAEFLAARQAIRHVSQQEVNRH